MPGGLFAEEGTMIIHTRYRDIPWEEARKCQTALPPEVWALLRGQAVALQTPPCSDCALDMISGCGNPPFLHTADGQRWVCQHIAEIGD